MSDEREPATISPHEKPQNGVAGLKHLRHDILSGIVVSLVSLPLSSGIAIASGLPPIYGLTSAIIAGLIFPFIGGSYMTIAGPAAGLAPAIMAVMISLGGAGDANSVGAGYPFLLVVIFLVGCCQLVISLLGLARYASAIPVAVVEGMLASIGMLIIAKQFKGFFGYTGTVNAKAFYEYVLAIPECASNLTMPVFVTSLITLIALFIFASLQKKMTFFRVMPPQLLAVVLGVIVGQLMGLNRSDSPKRTAECLRMLVARRDSSWLGKRSCIRSSARGPQDRRCGMWTAMSMSTSRWDSGFISLVTPPLSSPKPCNGSWWTACPWGRRPRLRVRLQLLSASFRDLTALCFAVREPKG